MPLLAMGDNDIEGRRGSREQGGTGHGRQEAGGIILGLSPGCGCTTYSFRSEQGH